MSSRTAITCPSLARARGAALVGVGQPAAAEHEDPFPGIGADDGTPFGDTAEHSDAERVARPDDRFQPRR